MGTTTATGAILIITGWFSLIEFDNYSEFERNRMIQKIKKSPLYILLIALMPLGIIINVVGSFFYSLTAMLIGATLIFIQGIIVSLLFWKRKRWKSIILLISVILLGSFIYLPFII